MFALETRSSRDAERRVENPYDLNRDPSEVSAFDLLKAGHGAMTATRPMGSADTNLFTEMRGQIAALHELTGDSLFADPFRGEQGRSLTDTWREVFTAKHDEIEQLKVLYPQAKLRNLAEMEEDARTFARGKLDEFGRLQAQAEGNVLAQAAGVVGQMVGSYSDPFNLMTLPISAGAGAGLVKQALGNGLVNAAVELVQAPAVQKYREELGVPAGVEEAAKDIGMAFSTGVGMTTLFGGLSRLVGRLRARSDVKLNAELEDALKVVEHLDDQLESRPASISAGAHLRGIEQATNDLDLGRLPDADALPNPRGAGAADLEGEALLARATDRRDEVSERLRSENAALNRERGIPDDDGAGAADLEWRKHVEPAAAYDAALRTDADDWRLNVETRAEGVRTELDQQFDDVLAERPDIEIADPRDVIETDQPVLRRARDVVDDLDERREYLEMFIACMTGVGGE